VLRCVGYTEKYEQITISDFCKEEKVKERKDYASPCGGCPCTHCANNVDCADCDSSKEADFACFNCDDCINYNGNKGFDNWISKCKKYKPTERHVQMVRDNFKICN
jgi:hypothetical protein